MNSITENKNILSNVSFQLWIKRCPNISFFIQKVSVPGIELGVVTEKTPFSDVPLAGEHMSWGEFEIIFLMDEDAGGYLEIFNWLTALGRPDDGEDLRKLVNARPIVEDGKYSDVTILVNDSKRNFNLEYIFMDAFPVALSGIDFDAAETDISVIPIRARFAYRRFVLNRK